MKLGLRETRERFGAALEARVDGAFGQDDEILLAVMGRAHMATGGKRIRGLLPSWIAENAAGAGERALDLGAGLELIHNATLVHDDLQDGDSHRRGQETLWRRFGAAQAINAGDGLYFLGMELLAGAADGAALVAPVSRAMLRVIEGQVMEFQLQRPAGDAARIEPGAAAWERMARGKTGALFGACFRAGAVAAGLGAAEIDGAAEHGEALGLVFQVQDDYLDLVGDKGRGQRGSDLAEGKLSFPVVWAYEHADRATADALRAILSAPRADTDTAMVERGLDLLARCGALDATAAWLRDARTQALEHPAARWVPGLAEEILAPVIHAL
ncbi:MAG: polyprenyl synthetase family protein [Deltaproteobacteria bacterium]|nr:polyprenyl synthetase family protein [Deltaproteobacteria bacterium]MCB9788819.1 polyprenyl synthetase family protein [Deltaproteobacteria bacterium]